MISRVRRNWSARDGCALRDPAGMETQQETAANFPRAGNGGQLPMLEVGRHFPVIPGRLSLAIYPSTPSLQAASKRMPHLVFYTSREEGAYLNYCSDFGPVDLATVVSYCLRTKNLLKDERFKDRELVHGSTTDEATNTNAAFLLGAYLVLVEEWTPEEAAEPFERIQPSPFKPFRDATHLPSDFDLSILDCLRGLALAHSRKWFSLDGFDFELFASQEDTGISRVCPKFFAFAGPFSSEQRPAHAPLTPEDLLPTFQHSGVGAVVRLNEASTYDARVFADAGIAHRDLFFPDCSLPSVEVTAAFVDICEQNEVVAVHCLAGLGRTGTLIAMWMMSTYGWRARETIGWLRIARPGSVIGAQQHFLVKVEHAMHGMDFSSPPPSRSPSSPSSPPSRVSSDSASSSRRTRPSSAASSSSKSTPPGKVIVTARRHLHDAPPSPSPSSSAASSSSSSSGDDNQRRAATCASQITSGLAARHRAIKEMSSSFARARPAPPGPPSPLAAQRGGGLAPLTIEGQLENRGAADFEYEQAVDVTRAGSSPEVVGSRRVGVPLLTTEVEAAQRGSSRLRRVSEVSEDSEH